MSTKGIKQFQLTDNKPGHDKFYAEVLSGLRKAQKELPSKYFYDQTGSRLFDQICTLEEYYIPRTEVAIMKSSYQRDLRNTRTTCFFNRIRKREQP